MSNRPVLRESALRSLYMIILHPDYFDAASKIPRRERSRMVERAYAKMFNLDREDLIYARRFGNCIFIKDQAIKIITRSES